MVVYQPTTIDQWTLLNDQSMAIDQRSLLYISPQLVAYRPSSSTYRPSSSTYRSKPSKLIDVFHTYLKIFVNRLPILRNCIVCKNTFLTVRHLLFSFKEIMSVFWQKKKKSKAKVLAHEKSNYNEIYVIQNGAEREMWFRKKTTFFYKVESILINLTFLF